MPFVKILSFISLFQLISSTRAGELPTATLASPLVPRQLMAGCGLNLNVWGQVSPTKTSGAANLCLQCRVNVLGVSVGFSFYDALAASISAHGISASDAAVLQDYISSDLLKISSQAKTSASCTTACKKDQRCQSCSFVGGSCRMTAVDYVNQNHNGLALAQAFEKLFLAGGPQYCSICPSDRSCGPTATGLPRRSVKKDATEAKCPSGLTACPLSPTANLTRSTAFECLDVSQELGSCGGCSTLGRGVNCSALRGVASSGCSDGKCKIFSCKPGFRYSEAQNVCYKRKHSKNLRSY